MSRFTDVEILSPYAKYEVFKTAYDTVNSFVKSENLISAFVLSFSILEDRLCAALVVCSQALNKNIKFSSISKMQFKQRAEKLLKIGAIQQDLHDRLLEGAYLRNKLTHEMMWRLDVFHASHIRSFRSLINELQKIQRKHEKLIESKT